MIYDAGVESQRKKNESIVINVKKGSIDELRKIFNKVEVF